MQFVVMHVNVPEYKLDCTCITCFFCCERERDLFKNAYKISETSPFHIQSSCFVVECLSLWHLVLSDSTVIFFFCTRNMNSVVYMDICMYIYSTYIYIYITLLSCDKSCETEIEPYIFSCYLKKNTMLDIRDY